jgi:predicted nucleic-acid-binding Zn-ribbon protein
MIMGRVVMHVATVGRDGGYPIEQLTYYIYCDKCGSFRITTRIGLKTWILITVPVLCAVAIWNNVKDHASPGAGVGCWSIFAVLLFGILWESRQRLGHKCRKCGNVHITENNVLNYRAFDKSVLDVPERLTHKHYFVD